jgi:hypothetical protein
MSQSMSERQRGALEHFERSQSEGVTLSAYARSRGLGVREIYDALAALRKKGLLAAAEPRGRRARSPFVTLRVATPVPTRSTVRCRVVIGAATVIECEEWPPAVWLASLSVGSVDAAA